MYTTCRQCLHCEGLQGDRSAHAPTARDEAYLCRDVDIGRNAEVAVERRVLEVVHEDVDGARVTRAVAPSDGVRGVLNPANDVFSITPFQRTKTEAHQYSDAEGAIMLMAAVRYYSTRCGAHRRGEARTMRGWESDGGESSEGETHGGGGREAKGYTRGTGDGGGWRKREEGVGKEAAARFKKRPCPFGVRHARDPSHLCHDGCDCRRGCLLLSLVSASTAPPSVLSPSTFCIVWNVPLVKMATSNSLA